MKRKCALFAVIALTITFTTRILSTASARVNSARIQAGTSAPDFTLADAKGAPVILSGYKGRVVLLNFWATWCHGCQTEIPWLVEFDKKYRADGLSVIGVSMDDDGWKVVKPYLQTKKVAYTIVIGDSHLGNKYGLDDMPLTVLIDRAGKVAEVHSGVVDREATEHMIETLLHKDAAAPR